MPRLVRHGEPGDGGRYDRAMAGIEPQLVLTRREWHRLIDAGVVGKDARIELLDGRISPLPAKSTHHATAVVRALKALMDLLPQEVWLVRPEQPLALSELSEPEPDIVVVPVADYLDDHPRPAEALLVAELSWTSLVDDRRKAVLYHQAGAANVWVVDLRRGIVETLGPGGAIGTATGDDTLSFGEYRVPVAALLA